MNHVYVLDDSGNRTFSSLLMNDLSVRNIRFSNIKTTKHIDYRNILIYIPRTTSSEGFMDVFVDNDTNNLFSFKKIFVVCKGATDYLVYKNMLRRNRMKYYQTLDFDTFCSTVVTNDCMRLVRNFNKFHNK